MTKTAYLGMTALARESADGLETGGILLGFDISDEVHVSVVGDAGPSARREENRFSRDLDHARSLADSAYDQMGAVWVGEWHTHPESGPLPSGLDLTSYVKLLYDDDLGFDRFVTIIVVPGLDGSWTEPQAAAWTIETSNHRAVATLTPLTVQADA